MILSFSSQQVASFYPFPVTTGNHVFVRLQQVTISLSPLCYNWWQSSFSKNTTGSLSFMFPSQLVAQSLYISAATGGKVSFTSQLAATSFNKSQKVACLFLVATEGLSSSSRDRWLVDYPLSQLVAMSFQSQLMALSLSFSRSWWLYLYISVTTGGSVFIFSSQMVSFRRNWWHCFYHSITTVALSLPYGRDWWPCPNNLLSPAECLLMFLKSSVYL